MIRGLTAILRATTAFLGSLSHRRRFRVRPRYRVTGNRNPFRVQRTLLHRAVFELKHSGPSPDDHA
jgi:hypothetical protein